MRMGKEERGTQREEVNSNNLCFQHLHRSSTALFHSCTLIENFLFAIFPPLAINFFKPSNISISSTCFLPKEDKIV